MADVYDITPGLIERVDEYYRARCMANASLPRLAKKLEEGKATYDDAYKYAEAIGKARADAFAHEVSSDVLPDGRMYYNIADRLLTETLGEDHEVVSAYATGVQELINQKSGINLAAQTADLDEDRIKGFVEGICNAEVYDDVAWKLGEPVVTHARTVVDDTVKKNAEFQGKAGVKATVIRNATSKCCEWCDDLAGDYTYPNVPREVFQRHDNCKCTVDYEGRRLTSYNSGGSSHSFRDQGEQERIDARKQEAERIALLQEQRTLTNPLKYGKIIIDGEEFTPCLRDVATGKIVSTQVERVNQRELKEYNKKTGWYVNWSEIPKDASIFRLTANGSSETQGLIAMTPNDAAKAMYLNWAVSAPQNNPMLLDGKPKKYEGVGGHLMAIAAEESVKHGYGGAAYGYAANKELVEYYIEKFGAIHLPIEHPYEVFYDEKAMKKLMETYDYARK